MYTLFGRPGAASLAPHILLHEAGLPHEFVPVDRDAPTPRFLAASPHGLVPAITDGRQTQTEAAAICITLADRAEAAALAPPQGDPARAAWYERLVFLCNTVGPALYRFIYPERYTAVADGAEGVKRSADAALNEAWDWLAATMPTSLCQIGDRFTAADAYLWMLLRWSRHQPRPGFDRPALGRFWAAVAARPTVEQVRLEEGLEIVGPVPASR